jgi:hypothetical protein
MSIKTADLKFCQNPIKPK